MATTVSLDDIQGLYIAYFNRPADYKGLLFWQTAANNAGGDINAVANAFAASPEYTSTFAGKNSYDIVDQIYLNLFGRHAELDGLNFWSSALDNKVLGVGNIAYQIMKGAQNADLVAVQSKIAAATQFYNALDTSAEVIGYSGADANNVARAWLAGVTDSASLAAATTSAALNAVTASVVAAHDGANGKTFTLTTGVDTGAAFIGSAGNDTFNATGSTFSGLDALDGGAGVNSLVISDAAGVLGTGVPAGVSVKNIQTVTINTAGGVGAAGAAGTPAVAQVNNYAFTAAAGADTVTVTYGTLSTTMNLTATAATNQANFIAAINALAGATIATAGAGTSVNVTAPVAGTALPTIAFSSFSVAGDAATITSTVATPNGAGVSGSSATVYDVSGFVGLTTVGITAAGSVNVKVADTTSTTVTDSANAAVTVTGGAAASVTTGTGAVVIAGNAGALASATVVGGTTVDVQTNASGSAVDKLTAVSLDGNTGAATIQSDALTSLTVAETNQNTTVTAAAATRVLGLTVNKLTGGTIQDNTATTVNVTSTGTASTGVTLAAAAATGVTIGGDKAVTLANLNAAAMTSLKVSGAALTTISAFGTTNKLATVAVTGAGGLKADVSGQTALTSVDASGSSGANSVTLGANTTFKGGSGVDTVTVTVAPTVSIDGGAGTNDVIIENSLTDILTGNTKITGFETLGLGALAGGGNTFDATGFSHLSIATGLAGAVTFGSVVAGADLSIVGAAGGAVTYSLANATGASDVLSLKLSAAAAVSNNVVAAGIETVNVALTDTNTVANHAAFSETLTLSAAAATKLVVTGNGALGLTLINTDTALTSVDASGLTVTGTGAANTGFVWTTGNLAAAATVKGSVNGGDTIDGHNDTHALTITVNGGTNSVTGGSVADTITAGNGSNTIVAGAGNDIVTVGSGANSITGGTGADLITLAAHAGKVDTIIQATGDSGANTATTNQTSVLTGAFDVVKGIAVGDVLNLAGVNNAFVTANLTFGAANLAAADNKVVFASGTYDATNGVFNFSTSGTDTLVTYDTDVAANSVGLTDHTVGQSIVLVGYHASATATTAAAGVVTLG